MTQLGVEVRVVLIPGLDRRVIRNDIDDVWKACRRQRIGRRDVVRILDPLPRLLQTGERRVISNLVVALSSTVGSEAWNSRDLKSRPH